MSGVVAKGRSGESVLSWRNASTGQPYAALRAATIQASSRGLQWNGLAAECGRATDWVVDDATTRDHLIAFTPSSSHLVERLGARGYTGVPFPANSILISPAGERFSLRVRGVRAFSALTIAPRRMQEVLGADHDLQPGYGVVDAALICLVTAVLGELQSGVRPDPLFIESLAIAIATRLAQRHARRRGALPVTGGLSAYHLRLVRQFIDDSLTQQITVAGLAQLTDLSPAHFSRSFKQSTRSAPHAYVMQRRVLRAQSLIAQGLPLRDTAAASGFFDQAHMTRQFRVQLGMTPGTLAARGQ